MFFFWYKSNQCLLGNIIWSIYHNLKLLFDQYFHIFYLIMQFISMIHIYRLFSIFCFDVQESRYLVSHRSAHLASMVDLISYKLIAKLSPNFNLSWTELVFILNFPPPPTHPPTHQPTQKSSKILILALKIDNSNIFQ